MLFNSSEFIFLFLPATLTGFAVLGRVSPAWALRWTIVASLFFYAWWRPTNVLLIAPSILINFVLARAMQRFNTQARSRAATAVLVLGIGFNVVFLGYFKYANFVVTAVNDVFGSQFALAQIVLPLGISFITFQKIAFLIDVHAGRVEAFTLQDYALFVLFFPQLIAGPIVHYREMMPQFHRATGRLDSTDIAVGLTLLVAGLLKKVYLADRLAPMVTPIYEHAAVGHQISLFESWLAALGFTLQIYFDFSGYTDMALGIARLVGIKLPPNFNSPLRATSVIDFWLRWHMSLTRFLTAYIYNPMTMWLTRRRIARSGAAIAGGRTAGRVFQLLAFPTMITMLISGIWHGAGYLFILWGLLHGLFLTINHAWRMIRPRLWRDEASYQRVMRPVGLAITLLCVVTSMVVFRSTSMAGAVVMFKGMAGVNGIALPAGIYDHLGPFVAWLQRIGVDRGLVSGIPFSQMVVWVGVLLLFGIAGPNSLQLMAFYEPALGWKSAPFVSWRFAGRTIAWRASLGWACAVSAAAATAILHLGGNTEFLYWQF
jgi:alginate O-acetyltransferase complex protein AlgI